MDTELWKASGAAALMVSFMIFAACLILPLRHPVRWSVLAAAWGVVGSALGVVSAVIPWWFGLTAAAISAAMVAVAHLYVRSLRSLWAAEDAAGGRLDAGARGPRPTEFRGTTAQFPDLYPFDVTGNRK